MVSLKPVRGCSMLRRMRRRDSACNVDGQGLGEPAGLLKQRHGVSENRGP